VTLDDVGDLPVDTSPDTELLLGDGPQAFFAGRNDCGVNRKIQVGLRLEGVSVLRGPGTYTTTVSYTIAAN